MVFSKAILIVVIFSHPRSGIFHIVFELEMTTHTIHIILSRIHVI